MDRDFYVEYDKDAQYCEVCKSCTIKDDDFGGQSLYDTLTKKQYSSIGKVRKWQS